MPFNNDIAGGNGVLVRNWIQSVNYVAGVSGWRISKDGNAEFNNGTFRGSIEVGPDPGQHFIVNNPATGDVIDVYDTNNNLVFKIDKDGILDSIDQSVVVGDTIQIDGTSVSFFNRVNPPYGQASIGGSSSTTGASLGMHSGATNNTDDVAEIQVVSANGMGGEAAIVGFQRGLFGSVANFDEINNFNMLHAGIYSATIAGGLGMATFSHNCDFTPLGGVVGPFTHFSQGNWNNSFGVNGFTSTQAQFTFYSPTGAALTNGTVPTFFAIFFA